MHRTLAAAALTALVTVAGAVVAQPKAPQPEAEENGPAVLRVYSDYV